MRVVSFFCICLAFLTSCTLDDDQRFVPETKGAYFLLNGLEGKSILGITEGNLSRDIATAWGISEELHDMSGNENILWLLAGENSLYEVNLEDFSSVSFQLEGIKPTYISSGEDYLLISDTSNLQLGFFHKKDKELTLVPTSRKPAKALYRSAKFFIPMDSIYLNTYHETGIAFLAETQMLYPIIDLESDNRTSILVMMKEKDRWYRASVDWNNSQVLGLTNETAIRIIRATPYFRSAYEKEWLRNVEVDTTRRLFLTKDIAQMEVDFFESDVYFVSEDTLERFNIRSRELEKLGVISEEIETSYFYIGNRD
ncbi:MAG: hypothetical protein MRZ79_16770 [Bacteroidia bacterium]|nr:hypothetical protein [Bacteroidia bacterium]